MAKEEVKAEAEGHQAVLGANGLVSLWRHEEGGLRPAGYGLWEGGQIVVSGIPYGVLVALEAGLRAEVARRPA